ncbi:hypothetical protein KFU94_03210 [Chloroflexi bacterium TSY]|nr:hypothetical protein [Chloroflexi bacterium TSY]
MSRTIARLLAVGPLPPPFSGATISFRLFYETVQKHMLQEDFPVDHLEIIDTSPKDLKKNTRIASFRNLIQAVRILHLFYRQVRRVDEVIIFGSNGFLLSLTPLLVGLARMAKTPCTIRSFGGSLDQFCQRLAWPLRWFLVWGLRHANRLIVETELLHQSFAPILGQRVAYIPAYRSMPRASETSALRDGIINNVSPPQPLRLIFIAWIRGVVQN